MEPNTQPLKIDASYAKTLKALHKPGKPIVLANIYDLSSLNALLSLNPKSKLSTGPVVAVATASYAIAETFGVRDEDLTYEQNFAGVAPIGRVVRQANLPLTVDIQDGYGDRLVESVQTAIKLGASGANIEDSIPDRGFGHGVDGSLRSLEMATERIRTALKTATEAGVPDFVVNARTDVMRLSPLPENALEEAIKRGKSFLAAGATTVFVWGGSRGLRTAEVERLVKEFDGMLAVKLGDGPDALTVKELADIGVARISVGPSLWMLSMEAFKEGATRILEGGRLHP